MASKFVEWFKQGGECDRQADRQTDHAMEKCVGIGGIACAARAIPLNNTDNNNNNNNYNYNYCNNLLL